jgi:hypothetical protein
MSPPYLEYSSAFGIFTPIELSSDENCPVCGKKKEKISIKIKNNSTFGDMISAIREKGIALPDTVLITNVIDGRVIAAPNQNIQDMKLTSLKIQNHDILRATYTSTQKNGKLERRQEEFIIDLEE